MDSPKRSWLGPPPEIQAVMNGIFQTTNTTKVDLFRHLKVITHLLSLLSGQYHKESLSMARMQLLVRLIVAQRLGNTEGISPSGLSEFLHVSRNTVSALLNGLEEQGLIERELHPTDRRQFLIRITPDGEALVHKRAPEFAEFVDIMFGALTPEEQTTLLALLDKVLKGLIARAEAMGIELPLHAPQPEPDTLS